MGTDRDGDGPPRDGERPSEQPIDDHPDLPRLPDGIRIPDDPAELADEAELVRAQLYGGRTQQPSRRRWRLGSGDGPPFATTVLLCLAIVIALVSLLAVVLPRPSDEPDP